MAASRTIKRLGARTNHQKRRPTRIPSERSCFPLRMPTVRRILIGGEVRASQVLCRRSESDGRCVR